MFEFKNKNPYPWEHDLASKLHNRVRDHSFST